MVKLTWEEFKNISGIINSKDDDTEITNFMGELNIIEDDFDSVDFSWEPNFLTLNVLHEFCMKHKKYHIITLTGKDEFLVYNNMVIMDDKVSFYLGNKSNRGLEEVKYAYHSSGE